MVTATRRIDECLKGLPCDAAGNAQTRRNLLASCADNALSQSYVMGACGDGAEGLLYWAGAFGWTYDPRLRNPHVPFVLWPYQREAVRGIFEAMEGGEDLLIEKSRDMGATWLCLLVFAWYFLFVPDSPLLVASRKEEYVDGQGNPDTLFWKLDYLLKCLPDWMQPKVQKRHMHLSNLETGSVIDGESTNADLARGGRRKAILLDEFAAVENGRAILAATADASPCRIFNSTPNGLANAFADVRFSGKTKILTLHWRRHPVKGAGVRSVVVGGKEAWTSPWYEGQCRRRVSRREIAENLDIDYVGSGAMFFDLDVCSRLQASGSLCPPPVKGEVVYEVVTRAAGQVYGIERVRFESGHGRRRLGLWLGLVGGKPPLGRYVAFADVSAGQGASNSVLKVADAASRREVAAWVCPDTMPQDFARDAVAVCRWFGDVLLGWEANGPGMIFGKEVLRCGYYDVLGNSDPTRPWEPVNDKIGWYSSRDKKEFLLSELRGAVARGELILRDEPTVREMEQYVYLSSGSLGPQGMIEETSGARAAHGDRVIATAGLLLCLSRSPRAVVSSPRVVPDGSFAARRLAYEEKRREAVAW